VRLLPLLLAGAFLVVPPRPARYATDLTGRLPAARVSSLNERLAAFERQTSTQVLIYVDSRVPANTTLDEFANRAFKEWGIGQKGKDNGVLFVVFLDDRVMRIEVGYGLEGALPDARAKQITSDFVKPRFKAGDYAGGVEAAADQIMAAARGEPYRGTGRTVAEQGGLPLFGKIALTLFGSVLVGTFIYGFGGGWRETRDGSPVARWSTRVSLVSATLLILSPLVFLWFSRLPPAAVVLALAYVALVSRIIAKAVGETGFWRVLGIVGSLGFMLAVTLGSRALEILATGLGDYRVFYAIGGGLVLGLLSLGRRDTGGRGYERRVAWASGDSSWSSSTTSSDSSSGSSSSGSSSSSDFSGGGGSSGGGGASDSW
jgi:uncharacterized protein